jgi:hypothetical protein
MYFQLPDDGFKPKHVVRNKIYKKLVVIEDLYIYIYNIFIYNLYIFVYMLYIYI